jgi:tRNA dimethylallyltransferase
MQVYRGMDIGTAKPTIAERAAVPHHLIDVADPSDEYTVAEFKVATRQALAEIEARGHRAVLVGGTGLYLRAVVDDLDFPGQFPEVRVGLDTEPTELLHAQLTALDPVAAGRMEPTNRRRVLRALEVTLGSGSPFSSFGPGLAAYPDTPFRMVGLRVDRDELDRRIEARYAAQLDAGFLDEVAQLRERPGGLSRTARQALGYRELLAHLDGECSLDEALEQAITRTRRFARRQDRWFRRDPRIEWVDAGQGSENVLARFADLLGD